MVWIVLAILAVVGLAVLLGTAPTISAQYTANLSVVETLGTYGLSGTANALTFNTINNTATLNAGSTPAGTVHSCFQKQLASGVATVDLTALPDLEGGTTTTGTGLKVNAIKITAPATNGAAISVTTGASNGYALFGAGGKVTLPPGGEHLALLPATGTIGSGAKTIDLAGAGSTDLLNFEIVMG